MHPWHFRPVSTLALLWYLAATVDYLLTMLRVPAYFALFTPEIARYVAALPVHVVSFWALAVWGGLLGAVLLLAGQRLAALCLAAAAAGMIYLAIWMVMLSEPPFRAVAGSVGDAVMIVSALVSIAIWAYARSRHAAERNS